MKRKPTRGERNRNPGNIERNKIAWQGMSADQSADPRFIVFETAEYGIRALCKVLLTYYTRHGLETVEGLINRWAPPSENDSGAYVDHVCRALGVEADEEIEVSDPDTLALLAKAIIKHENGRVIYSQATINRGVALALS